MSAVAVEPSAVRSPNGTPSDAPDPNAGSADSLAEILEFDTLPTAKFWHPRWRRWVHLRGMDVGEKKAWIRRSVVEDADGKQSASLTHQQDAVALCWVTSKGVRVADGEIGIRKISEMHPLSFDILWEEVAKLNALRVQDNESLKNDSGATTTSGTSADSPASTA